MIQVLKIEDLIGTTYGRFTILEEGNRYIEPNGKAQRVMVCECSCGTIKNITLKELRRGNIKSCGCLAKDIKIKVKPNDIYGHWTVVEECESYRSNKNGVFRRVLAKCICGKEKQVLLNSLKKGHSKSCGCMRPSTKGIKCGKRINIDSLIPKINIDKINERDLGNWTVLEEISAKRNEKLKIERTVKVQCGCGYIKETKLNNIYDSKQCWTCAMDEIRNKVSDEDRTIRERLKRVYGSIKGRCTNPNNKDYKNYGGRGIKVDDSFSKFSYFYNWAISQGYTYDCKLEIDRRDNNGNYSIDNCRLITKAENSRNMRSNVITWELVNEIRYGKYVGMSNKNIAEDIGCCTATITSVRNNKTWVENT